MWKSDPHKASYATLLKSHLRIGAPPQIHCAITENLLEEHCRKAASVLISN